MSPFRHASDAIGRYFRTSIYARLLPYLRPYKLFMAIVVAILLAQVGLNVLEPWATAIVIDCGILNKKALPAWLIQVFPILAPGNGLAIIIFAVIFGIAVRLLGQVLDVAGDYLKSRVNDGMAVAFQADLFNHLQRLSFSYHDQTSVGDSLYRLNNDTGFISTHLWGNFRHLLMSGATLVAMFWIVVWMDWVLAVVSLSVAPVLYLSVWLYGKYFRAKSKRVKEMESEVQTILEEVLSCLRVVKAFGREQREQRRFEAQSWAALFARLRLSLEQAIFSSTMSFITKVIRSVILLVGGYHALMGRIAPGDLTVIMAYIAQIHGPLEDIGQTLTDMQLSMASAERVIEVMDIEPEIRDKPNAVKLQSIQGAVGFQHVTFGYSTDYPVLREINFSVKPGEVVAVVGPTGAGKTTLANLIARFYDPCEGRVMLDGYDLRDLTIDTLRDNLALVIQEPILFSTTIRDNICYGRPEASMEEIIAAARAANAHDFIMALPHGYKSQVGERGVKLSGGQRQRIAVARAFLKDAPVLILDEPTSSVDSRTEMVIIDALDRLMANRTTFIIAHRLSTIRRADQIIVLDDGRIVEHGTHPALMAQKGLYAQLYRIQSSGLLREKDDAEGEVA